MNTIASNHMMLDLETEISNITELIQMLTEAEESITQRLNIIRERSNAIQNEVRDNKHSLLKGWIDLSKDQIISLQQFHLIKWDNTLHKPAEAIQRLKIKFHNSSKSLATERKMLKELQLREREERQEQSEIQVEEQNLKLKSYRRRYYSGWRPLGNNTNSRSIIRIWAEKVEYVSSLVLRDSKNLTPTQQTEANLNDLLATRSQIYWDPNCKISMEELKKHWDSMKQAQNSIQLIELELKKVDRRHQASYAEIERLRNEKVEIQKPCWELQNESKKLLKEKSIARKYLVKLQKQQNEIISIGF